MKRVKTQRDEPTGNFVIDKRVRNVGEALQGIRDGAVILLGGFGVVGQPQELLRGPDPS